MPDNAFPGRPSEATTGGPAVGKGPGVKDWQEKNHPQLH